MKPSKNTLHLCLICCIGLISISCSNVERTSIVNLSGTWQIQLDPNDVGKKEQWFLKQLSDTLHLPGTTDEAGLGEPEQYTDPYNALIRPHYYVGKAWYQREVEIPEKFDGKHFTLLLERVHWVSEVWINGQFAGSENSLCTAQEYDVSDFITPGKNSISICVSNKYPFSLGSFASSVSEHTQTNWNGIVGRIELQVKDHIWMDDLRVYPDIKNKTVKVTAQINNPLSQQINAKIDLSVNLIETGKSAVKKSIDVELTEASEAFEAILEMGDDVQLWDEFTPNLYKLSASLSAKECSDVCNINFGMREVGVDNNIFTINGKRTYMRGNLECCIFPLTGYPSMDVDSWVRIMRTQKDLGMNHVRFHSWCPPKAAFDAADIVGMYIQAEAPRANVGADKVRDAFIFDELIRINCAYGNNPSFMFMTGGNELAEDDEKDMENVNMIARALKNDNRHLYSVSSGGRGMDHKQSRAQVDQYRVGGARGFYGPGTEEDKSAYYSSIPYASITHEVGQHAAYPNMKEISKYTGVLKPVNLVAIKNDLEEKEMLELADVFLDATVKHSAILYKEEIEILLRSERNAGFQLLSLHDYPGQGTAHVGLFDAFWDNKGGISAEAFRKFCGPVTPLLRFKKRTYSSDETFNASAEILNYGPTSINNSKPVWSIRMPSGKILQQGYFNAINIPQGERVIIGNINADLSRVKSAAELRVSVGIEGTDYLNDWDIWCYPAQKSKQWPSNLVVSHTLDKKAKIALKAGKNVLLLPSAKVLNSSFKGNPKTVFWSPTWWWTRPRGGNVTMSILCNPEHPLFENFPTERHSNWQWWSLQKMSNSINLDTLQLSIQPIVRVIDNYSRNHKLASLIELKCEKGKLMICSMDIEKDLEKRPEAKQFRNSIITYMGSEKFNPETKLTLEKLALLFK